MIYENATPRRFGSVPHHNCELFRTRTDPPQVLTDVYEDSEHVFHGVPKCAHALA